MKIFLSFLSFLSFLVVSSYALTTNSLQYNLVTGWNLIGTGLQDRTVVLADANMSSAIKLIWTYDVVHSWKAYSRDALYRDFIGSDIQLNRIFPGSGVWVLTDSPTSFTLGDQVLPTVQYVNLFTGSVKTDSNGTAVPLSDVNVTIFGTGGTFSSLTDVNGTYVFNNLPFGEYNMTMTHEGYTDFNTSVPLNSSEISYQQIQLQSNSNNDMNYIYTLDGIIKDAITGSSVENVTVKAYQGLDNQAGTPYKETNTSSDGSYSLAQLPAGNYTIVCSKDGYVNAINNIQLLSSQNNATITQDFTIAPFSQNTRIVLSWGASPSDLDSHLVKTDENGTRYWHIYYNNESETGVEANLDTDDTDSYGPETTTLSSMDSNGTYKYYVHDFTNRFSTDSNALSNSGAKVTVYMGNTQNVFYVPSYAGTVWKVFEIKNGVIVPCIGASCMSYANDSNSATFGLLRLLNNRDIDFSNLPAK